jgi:hypothetical protein
MISRLARHHGPKAGVALSVIIAAGLLLGAVAAALASPPRSDQQALVFAPKAPATADLTDETIPTVAAPATSLTAASLDQPQQLVDNPALRAFTAKAGSIGECPRSRMGDQTAEMARVPTSGYLTGAVAVTRAGTSVRDAPGHDTFTRSGSTIGLPGEVNDLTDGAFPGESLVAMSAEVGRSHLLRVTSSDTLVDVPLPAGTEAVLEVEALAGGGAVAALQERSDGEFLDLANLWHLDTTGSWTRLLDLTALAGGDDWAVVKDLRATAAGRVMATALAASGGASSAGFESRRVVVDPLAGTTTVDLVVDGEAVFDETADRLPLVGVDRIKSAEYISLPGTLTDQQIEAVFGTGANPASTACQPLPPGRWAADPDRMAGPTP